MTQEDLAELTGVSTRSIQRAEAGGRMGIATLKVLCRALDLPVGTVIRRRPDELRARLRAHGLLPPPPSDWDPDPSAVEVMEACVKEATTGAPTACCIAGPPGIGKTALARHLAARLDADFPDGILWLDAQGLDTEDRLALVRDQIARALGFRELLPARLDVNDASLRLTFLHHLWRRTRLVILDDVADPRCAKEFLPPDDRGGALITTSLRHVAEHFATKTMKLEGISEEAAWAILASYAGAERLEADPEGTAELLRLLGGIPRHLHMAGRVLQREVFLQPGDQAARMKERLGSSGEGSAAARRAGRASALRELRMHLSPEAWQLLRQLGVFRSAPFPASWAAVAGGVPEREARRLLSELTDLHLVRTQGSEGTAEPLAALDVPARWLAAMLIPGEQRQVLARLALHMRSEARRWSAEGPTALWSAHRRHRPVWRVCMRALSAHVDLPFGRGGVPPHGLPAADLPADSPARHLPAILSSLEPLYTSHPIPEVRRWLHAAVAVARGGADGRTHGRLLLGAASLHASGGSEPGAVETCFDQACAVLREAGDVAGELGGRLAAARHAGAALDLDRARELAEEAHALAEAGGLSPEQRAQVANSLAAILTRSEADDDWRRARALFRRGRGLASDPWIQAVIEANLGLVDRILGEPSDLLEGALHRLLDLAGGTSRLFRTHLLLHASHAGLSPATGAGEDLASQWVAQTRSASLEEAPDIAFLLGYDAFFLRASRGPRGARLAARGTMIQVVPEDLHPVRGLPGTGGMTLPLLLHLAPLDALVDLPWIDATLEWLSSVHGLHHRACVELRALRAVLSG